MVRLNRWAELVLLGFARISMGLQFQAVGALGPLLVGPLVPDYTGLGSLIGAYSLAGVVLALPAGWLLARFGDGRILRLGLLLMTLGGLAMAAAPGFWSAMAGRLVSGGGSALLTIACAKLVLDRFAGRSLAPAMGVMLSAWPIGIALALLLLPLFGEAWRMGLLAAALLCAAGLLAIAWGVPAERPAAASAPRAGRLLPGEWLPLLTVGALWATYNAAYAVVLGFLPAFLVAAGESAASAGAVASLVGWAILPLLPLGGALAERLGRPLLACGLCMAAMAAALLALLAGAPSALALIGFGLLAGPPASLIMALLGRVLSAESRAFGVGIHYMMFYGGLALLPPLAGWLRDRTGSPAAPMLGAVGFLLLSLVLLAAIGWQLRPAQRLARMG
ncbi:MFS transporter [Belnapia rosea]|uniref:MFS transporter n=1 Tax=Belnapia rosea TaxID=938405 RepID=UPI0008875796|nr:MFS transporter [Belnapia rosea]SDB14740.1 Predicted arabinose efflux permease, MFS family [Belnapia rosea]